MTNSGLAKEETMHATAVETIAPQSKGPLETPRRILPPTFSFLLRWGFLALIAIVAVLSTVLGLMFTPVFYVCIQRLRERHRPEPEPGAVSPSPAPAE